jgi:hypothetical protein
MMKEEKELRKWVRWATCDLPDAEEKRFAFKTITALIRAVREECAKVADSFHEPPYPSTTSSMYTVPQKIAIAIRRKGK